MMRAIGTNSRTAYMFGFLAGVAVLCPFLGQSFGVSARILSVLPFLAACATYLFCRRETGLSRRELTILALLSAYVLLVILSAYPEQWQYLLHPSSWGGHRNAYVASKLMMFFVTCIPPIILGLMLWTLRDRDDAIYGLMAGIAAVALTGFLILALNSNGLLRSDYGTASDWYHNRTGSRANFSIISMSIMLAAGGLLCVTCLTKSQGINILYSSIAGIALFCIIMLGRRADTIIFLIACAVIIFWHRRDLAGYLKPALLIVILPAVLFPTLANDFVTSYWVNIGSGIAYRTAFAEQVMNSEAQTFSDDQQAGPGAADPLSLDAPEIKENSDYPFILGKGLGAYAIEHSDTRFKYPHNLLLETMLESGFLAFLSLSAIFVLSTAPLLPSLVNGQLSLSGIYGSGMATVMLLLSLKTGDIAMAGPVLFFSLWAASFMRTDARRITSYA